MSVFHNNESLYFFAFSLNFVFVKEFVSGTRYSFESQSIWAVISSFALQFLQNSTIEYVEPRCIWRKRFRIESRLSKNIAGQTEIHPNRKPVVFSYIFLCQKWCIKFLSNFSYQAVGCLWTGIMIQVIIKELPSNEFCMLYVATGCLLIVGTLTSLVASVIDWGYNGRIVMCKIHYVSLNSNKFLIQSCCQHIIYIHCTFRYTTKFPNFCYCLFGAYLSYNFWCVRYGIF